MRSHIRYAVVLGAAVVASVPSGSARADFLSYHASTAASGTLTETGPSANDGPNYGAYASSAAATVSDQHGVVSSRSSANIFTDPLSPGPSFTLSARADATIVLSTPLDYASAEASWQDVLYLSGANPGLLGSTLRLNFSARGALLVDHRAGASTSVTVSGSSDGNRVSTSSATTALNTTNGFSASGWDVLQGDSNGFQGTFHLDIPISNSGYVPGVPYSFYFGLVDYAEASAGGNSTRPDLDYGSAMASDPIGFLSVTLPDVGNVTPESLGFAVRFDSGIASPNAAPGAVASPAPPGVLLALTGAGCLGGFGWVRRRTPAAAV